MSLLNIHKISNKDPQWETLLKDLIFKIINIEVNAQVFIFGSFVRDNMRTGSDIDLAVILPDGISTKEFLKKIYKQNDKVSQWPLDLLVFNKSYFENKSQIGGVCFEIREDGVELYPRWSLNVTAK